MGAAKLRGTDSWFGIHSIEKGKNFALMARRQLGEMQILKRGLQQLYALVAPQPPAVRGEEHLLRGLD
jgi:hypothetical protein